ncbi:MAG: hypothetical protein E7170_02595 [Firmicutes bacterium]|nr:hypothetical protein [Bacillota bacterium]
MLKKIFSLFKRIIISAFALYGYNLIAAPTGLIVPINLITISILTVLGLPSLMLLIIILVIIC